MHVEGDASRMDELIGSIYDACLDNSRWSQVVKTILRLLGANGGQLWSPLVPPDQGVVDTAETIDATTRADYAAYYRHHDIWLHRSTNQGRILEGNVFTDRTLVTEQEFKRGEFWNDFLSRTDSYRMCTGIVADGRTGDMPLVALTSFRGVRAPDFGQPEQQIVARLLPHLRRALTVQVKIDPAAASPAELALERLAIPVMVVARNAAVLLANPAAERLAMTHRALRIRHGRLCLSDGEKQRRLEELLCHAAVGFTHLHPGAPTVFCCGDSAYDGLICSVVPLRPSDNVTNPNAVAMLLFRTTLHDSVSETDLRTVYGLTPAEAELAAALIRGNTLEEIAHERQVSINTVRTQLKNILRKTDTSRQADLIRVLLSRHMPLV